MASRNLTGLYQDLRERHHRSSVSFSNSRPALGSKLIADDIDVEMGSLAALKAPPVWMSIVEDFKSEVEIIGSKLQNLSRIHGDRLKVTFQEDEAIAQDRKIDVLTADITDLLRDCENKVKLIAVKGSEDKVKMSYDERMLRLNIMRGMASKLRNVSKKFRSIQKDFLLRLKASEEIGKEYFPEDDSKAFVPIDEALDQELTQEQLDVLAKHKEDLDSRTQEIAKIAESINHLATMFKDLSLLVVEQGSILDRVDYNIEQAKVKVKSGREELIIADRHSERSSRRSLCIMCSLLIGITVCIIIIISKSKK